jgi:hypothetical protein
MHTGSCLCGAVSFTVDAALKPPDACHCTFCRKSSGHYTVGTDVPRTAVTIRGGEHVTWYRSSEKVRRGFCGTCGSLVDGLDLDDRLKGGPPTRGSLPRPSGSPNDSVSGQLEGTRVDRVDVEQGSVGKWNAIAGSVCAIEPPAIRGALELLDADLVLRDQQVVRQ